MRALLGTTRGGNAHFSGRVDVRLLTDVAQWCCDALFRGTNMCFVCTVKGAGLPGRGGEAPRKEEGERERLGTSSMLHSFLHGPMV